MNFKTKINQIISSVSRRQRLLFLISIDSFLISFAIFLSLIITNQFLINDYLNKFFWMLPTSILIGIPTFIISSQYKNLSKYLRSKTIYDLFFINSIFLTIVFFIGKTFNLYLPKFGTWIIILVFLTGLLGFMRFALRDFLIFLNTSNKKINKVVIYGAGSAGAQLAASLRLTKKYKILFFVDDDEKLWGRELYNIKIKSFESIIKNSDKIEQILFAIPSLSQSENKSILGKLYKLNIPVLQVPTIEDLSSGKTTIEKLIPISIEDLLGRSVSIPDDYLLSKKISGSVVCVTGAGGSIGSELCRKIVDLSPKCLILVDHSEPDLYLIHQELIGKVSIKVKIKPILGNVCNKELIDLVFQEKNVDIVFHAAAYKHVPLVEENPLQGIQNNVFSTFNLCMCAKNSSVKDFLLISTDKAVRPTNIMGASKRLAEMVVQAFSEVDSNTIFSMVRFGNVLGSSGSVVPLFRKQIAKGGPITLTHPDVIRYFMTISEAADLVIQALTMSQGGDLFLLDMGEPMRIKDLAIKMIRLSGLTVKSASKPDGDIEILTTGLRPGEKLFEELLIDAKSEKTIHSLIFRAREKSISMEYLKPLIDQLNKHLRENDKIACLNILSTLVPEWTRDKSLNL